MRLGDKKLSKTLSNNALVMEFAQTGPVIAAGKDWPLLNFFKRTMKITDAIFGAIGAIGAKLKSKEIVASGKTRLKKK